MPPPIILNIPARHALARVLRTSEAADVDEPDDEPNLQGQRCDPLHCEHHRRMPLLLMLS